MDRINGLPDEVLCHTLSFLSLKEAALTSLMSKRWRNLFAFTPNLCFQDKDKDFVDLDVSMSFTDFVDRVLAVSDNSPVKTFSVKYRRRIVSARINLWICNVLSRRCGGGLELLELDVIANGVTPLPLAVFTCKTLVKLKLGSGFVIPVIPKTASLPALKILFLDCVRFYNDLKKRLYYDAPKTLFHDQDRPFETLVAACHVLEELTILGGMADQGNLCRNVSCPTLQRLTINCQEDNDFYRFDFRSNTFDTPSLTYLDYIDYVADEYLVVNLDSLIEAKLNLRLRMSLEPNNPTNLIKGLRNVEILTLSTYATCQIFRFYGEVFPLMGNLSRLSVEICYKYWEYLPLLLKNSPNLQTLVIKGSPWHCLLYYGGYECLSGYAFLLSCPLKVLEINRFWGTVGELGHLQRLLENLPCLELVKVSAWAKDSKAELQFDEKAKLQLATDLQMLPGASKIQLKFY